MGIFLALDYGEKRTGIAVTTEVVKEMPIQGHDTMNLTAGKLVIEQGDSLKLASSAPGHVKFIASILETLN